jgi:hypothetical protein
MIRIPAITCAVMVALLGGRWSLQRLGIVQIWPIECLANCTPIQGRSTTWAAIRAVTLVTGGFGIVRSRNHVPLCNRKENRCRS